MAVSVSMPAAQGTTGQSLELVSNPTDVDSDDDGLGDTTEVAGRTVNVTYRGDGRPYRWDWSDDPDARIHASSNPLAEGGVGDPASRGSSSAREYSRSVAARGFAASLSSVSGSKTTMASLLCSTTDPNPAACLVTRPTVSA
jgi:hypothetical protein